MVGTLITRPDAWEQSSGAGWTTQRRSSRTELTTATQYNNATAMTRTHLDATHTLSVRWNDEYERVSLSSR